jgi:hypothetical protein
MIITGNIMAVTAIALGAVGNYFIFRGQSNSQEKLLKIDRELQLSAETRSSKKSAYADLLAAIEELYEAKFSRNKERKLKAEIQINRALATVDIIGPAVIYRKASFLEDFATLPRTSKVRNQYLDELTSLMREDLQIKDPKYLLGKIKY